ncbi:MAG: type II toxin-antitoxin system RelE/ParE family toxin [Gemmataceae bacterium]
MSLPVVFLPEARAEFDSAYDYYEHQRPGLGDDFLKCDQDAIDSVAVQPAMHQFIFADARRAVVRRFAFSVIYRVVAGQLLVVAAFHGRRDPQIWQNRI